MQLNMNLKEKKGKGNEKDVHQKVKGKTYQPTWNELWFTGYTRHTGTVKDGIFQTKLTDTDRIKLQDVKKAIESGELGVMVDDMKKFTKSHAIKLHAVLKEQRRESIIAEMVRTKPDNYHCVLTGAQFHKMIDLMESEHFIGLDTETTGLDKFGIDHVVGLSISCPLADQHFYVPVRHNVPEEQLEAEMVFKALKPYLEDEQLGKVLHNAPFDAHMLRREGIELEGIIMDTMVSMHILSENEMSYSLKNLATKWGGHFGFEDRSATYEELFGKGGFQDTPLDIGTVYACKDTHLVIRFYDWIMSHLMKQPKLMDVHDMETAIIRCVIAMEKNGFDMNLDFASEYLVQLKAQIAELEAELIECFGEINMNSPEQLKKVLFGELGLPDNNNGSVDAETLKELAEEHAGVELLLKYRELTKLVGTYIEPLPQKISLLDGRLHGSFKQTGAKTGRFSANDPNLQNQPYEARKLFKAPEGRLLMGSDFSKVEPTILGDMTGDEKYKAPFLKGLDIYSSLASGTFNKPYEEVGDGSKERKMMKTGLLATMYGTSNFTLSKQLNITVDEAEQFIETFMTSYPVMAQWIADVHAFVDQYGYVETAMGRKRRFLGHKKVAEQFKAVEAEVVRVLGRKPKNIWQEKEVPYRMRQKYWGLAGKYFRVHRQAVNAIIQGTGAEIMKLAMVRVLSIFEQWNKQGDRKFLLLATVHDEILMEVPEDLTLKEVETIEQAMTGCVQMSLPLLVDTELMKVWGEGVKKSEWFTENH